MDKYRFDDGYEKVYEYDEKQKAYMFIGTYYSLNITKKTTTKQAIKKVEKNN